MDDLAGKLTEMLQDPSTMDQIRSLAGMLGQGSQPEPAPSPVPSPQPAQTSGLPALSPDAMRMVMKLTPLLANMNRETDSTRFLHALRPLLGPEKQKKLDTAIRMMQLSNLLPLLKDQGLF